MTRAEEPVRLLSRQPRPGFERHILRIDAGASLERVPADWSDALISLEGGRVEFVSAHGSRRTFTMGALLWTDGLWLAAIRSLGPGAAVIVTIRRDRYQFLSRGAVVSTDRRPRRRWPGRKGAA
jgi:hypothetical protein